MIARKRIEGEGVAAAARRAGARTGRNQRGMDERPPASVTSENPAAFRMPAALALRAPDAQYTTIGEPLGPSPSSLAGKESRGTFTAPG